MRMRHFSGLTSAVAGVSLVLALSAPSLAQPFQWQEETPPSALISPTLIYDGPRDRLLMLGGRRALIGAPLAEFWSFKLGEQWTRLPDAPETLEQTHLVHDTHRDRLVYYGSSRELCCQYYGGMGSIGLNAEPGWTALPSGDANWIRGVAVYDSLRDRIVNWRMDAWFSGVSDQIRTFPLSGTTPWLDATSIGTPPPLSIAATPMLDIANDRMLVLDLTSGALWQLRLSNLEWTAFGTGAPGLSRPLIGAGLHTTEQRVYAVDRAGALWARELAPVSGWQALPAATGAVPPGLPAIFAWDMARKRLFFKPEAAGSLVALHFDLPAHWEELSPTRPEAPRAQKSAITMDPTTGNAVLGSGVITRWGQECRFTPTLAEEFVSTFHTFPLRSGGKDWSLVLDRAFPPNASIVVDPARARALYFGGTYSFFACSEQGGGQTFILNDGSAVDLRGTQPLIPFNTSTLPPPLGRYSHGAVWDARRDRMLIAAGWRGYQLGLQDLWELSGATLEWRPITTTGPAPLGANRLFLDTRNDRIIAVPGWDAIAGPNNRYIYFLDPTTSVWSRFDTGRVIPSGAAVEFDANADRLLVFGGRPDGQAGHSLWEIPLSNLSLARILAFPNEPPFSEGATMVHDPVSNRLLLHAGKENGLYFEPGTESRTTWTLEFSAPTPTALSLVLMLSSTGGIRLHGSGVLAGAEVEIDRKIDDEPWSSPTRVASDREGRLEWNDTEARPGHMHRYRIRARDALGRSESIEREILLPVKASERFRLAPIRPNPVSGSLVLGWTGAPSTPVKFTVRDIQGRTVQSWEHPAASSASGIVQRLPDHLSPGLYHITARTDAGDMTRSFVVIH